jgi:hypothetical protein
MLKGSVHMRKWIPDITPRYVLFPYQQLDGRFLLIPQEQMKTRFPASWDYLQSCRDALANRERGRDQGETWYGYVYPKNFAYMTQPKLLVPSMLQHPEFGFDDDGSKFFVGSGAGGGGGYGIILPANVSYQFILGILNSRLIEYIARAAGTPFQNGWYSYDKGVLEDLPIKMPVIPAERRLAERIESAVDQIIRDKKKLQSGSVAGDRDRRDVETAIEENELRINDDVQKLYNINNLP